MRPLAVLPVLGVLLIVSCRHSQGPAPPSGPTAPVGAPAANVRPRRAQFLAPHLAGPLLLINPQLEPYRATTADRFRSVPTSGTR
jgi:hypothetical protein